MEVLGQTLLDTQICGSARVSRGRLPFEHRRDPLLVVSNRLLAGGKAVKDVAVFGFQIGVCPLDLFTGGVAVARHVKLLIDERDVVAIVNDEVTLAPVGERLDPKLDIGLEQSRPGKGGWPDAALQDRDFAAGVRGLARRCCREHGDCRYEKSPSGKRPAYGPDSQHLHSLLLLNGRAVALPRSAPKATYTEYAYQ